MGVYTWNMEHYNTIHITGDTIMKTEVIAARVGIVELSRVTAYYVEKTGMVPRKGEVLRFAVEGFSDLLDRIEGVDRVNEEVAMEYLRKMYPGMRISRSAGREEGRRELTKTMQSQMERVDGMKMDYYISNKVREAAMDMERRGVSIEDKSEEEIGAFTRRLMKREDSISEDTNYLHDRKLEQEERDKKNSEMLKRFTQLGIDSGIVVSDSASKIEIEESEESEEEDIFMKSFSISEE